MSHKCDISDECSTSVFFFHIPFRLSMLIKGCRKVPCSLSCVLKNWHDLYLQIFVKQIKKPTHCVLTKYCDKLYSFICFFKLLKTDALCFDTEVKSIHVLWNYLIFSHHLIELTWELPDTKHLSWTVDSRFVNISGPPSISTLGSRILKTHQNQFYLWIFYLYAELS